MTYNDLLLDRLAGAPRGDFSADWQELLAGLRLIENPLTGINGSGR